MEKPCSVCGTVKQLEDFNIKLDGKFGRSARCRDCQHKYQQDWYRKNSTKIKARHRKNQMSSRYGITLEDYEIMLAKQDYKCAICLAPRGAAGKRLSVDHNHQTGAVRGLLCDLCNTGLGKFKDDPSLLAKAIDYLAD